MATTVSYKGSTIATVSNNTKTLETEGKYLEADIILTDNTHITTLQSKSVTPTESAQAVIPDSGYDGLSQVDVGAISSTYVGTGVSRQAAQTIYPSSSDQTIAADKYLTGTQTIKGVTTSNITAANIKKDVVVEVGDSADSDRILSITGTYEGEQVVWTKSAETLAHEDTVLDENQQTWPATSPDTLLCPASDIISAAAILYNYSGSTEYPYPAFVNFDTYSWYTKALIVTSTGQADVVNYDNGGYRFDIFNPHPSGAFYFYGQGQAGNYTSFGPNDTAEYKYLYCYGGPSSDVHSTGVQVGEGATSITFDNLDDTNNIIYWACYYVGDYMGRIDASTDYYRVIGVVGTLAENGDWNCQGTIMLSRPEYHNDLFMATLSNHSLTINALGITTPPTQWEPSKTITGYFHQPGYYELTYVTSNNPYQTKRVTPTATEQIITADSGYDALEKVIVGAASGGGGSTFSGSFTTPSTGATKNSISIPYSGNGFQVALSVFIDGGYGGNSTIAPGGVASIAMVKADYQIPTYSSNTSRRNSSSVLAVIFNNSSDATRVTYSYSVKNVSHNANGASADPLMCVQFTSNTEFQYITYNGSQAPGLLPNKTYHYILTYSE